MYNFIKQEQEVFSKKTLFFHQIVTTTCNSFPSAMNKSLHTNYDNIIVRKMQSIFHCIPTPQVSRFCFVCFSQSKPLPRNLIKWPNTRNSFGNLVLIRPRTLKHTLIKKSFIHTYVILPSNNFLLFSIIVVVNFCICLFFIFSHLSQNYFLFSSFLSFVYHFSSLFSFSFTLLITLYLYSTPSFSIFLLFHISHFTNLLLCFLFLKLYFFFNFSLLFLLLYFIFSFPCLSLPLFLCRSRLKSVQMCQCTKEKKKKDKKPTFTSLSSFTITNSNF